MNNRKTVAAVILMLVFAGGFSAARDISGRRGFIQTPLSTVPVFVQPGGKVTMEVSAPVYDNCSCAFHAFLEKDGASLPLKSARIVPGGSTGTYRIEAMLPDGIAPGNYGLALRKGQNNDVSKRAVIVVDSFPGEYTIMHITDVHVGRMSEDGAPKGERAYARMKDEANRIKPDLIVITGDLSDTSAPEQFKTFIDITEQMEAPVFVVPGNHDRNNSDAAEFTGPLQYSFVYGNSYFLGFDTQEQYTGRALNALIDSIKKDVRANQQKPFKALFSHRAESDFRFIATKVVIPMKINLLLLGHTHMDTVEAFGALPSRIVTTPAALEGFYRLIKVKNNSVADMQLVNINQK